VTRAFASAILVAGVTGCSHEAGRWNRENFAVVYGRAMEETTRQPLYAEATSVALVYSDTPHFPGSGGDRHRDPKAQTIFTILLNGSECGDAFAAGSAEVIWKRFTAAARRERTNLSTFRQLVESTRAKLGEETRLRGEYVVATPGGVSYLRDSEWSNAPKGMVLELPFAPDSTSEISGLSLYRSETRPIVVKPGEALNAGR
jgi:hypothetical protein